MKLRHLYPRQTQERFTECGLLRHGCAATEKGRHCHDDKNG